MKCSGQIISQGIALGKARFLKTLSATQETQKIDNQLQLFLQAINTATLEIEKQIDDTKNRYSERISEIFLTQKYIINDPVILEQTKAYIESGMTAQQAYKLTIDNIMLEFTKIANEYMLGRIVDILDATDKVKVALRSVKQEVIQDDSENTILILKHLKPSVIYDTIQHNISGFISSEGYYSQHSGIIAREVQIPGMVCKDILENVAEGDMIIIDTKQGLILINPEDEIINRYQKEARP